MSSQQSSGTHDSEHSQGHKEPQPRIHWRAPAAIIVSFLAAFVFAASHHILYSFLDHTAVSDVIFEQQAIVAAGTAFAFLFRASLMIGLAATYYQVLWWAVRRRPLTFSTLDSLGGLITSMLELLNYRAILFSPALASLAILMWVIPIASVFPPATLSISQSIVISKSSRLASTINYQGETLSKYSNGYVMSEINSQTWYKSAFSWYGQPSDGLLRTTTATAVQGSVLEMLADEANATYTTKFHGPSVQCKSVSSDIMEDWKLPLHCDPRLVSPSVNRSCPLYFDEPRSLRTNRVTYMYIGWLPDAEYIVPFGNESLGSPWLPNTRGSLGSHRGGPISILIVSRKSMDRSEWKALNCSFYNATFTADFNFDERMRALPSVRDVQILDPITASIKTPWHANTTLSARNAVLFNYMAIMQCLCDILYGMVYTPVATNSPLADDASQWGPLLYQTALGATKEISPMMLTALKKPVLNDSDWTFPITQPSYAPNTPEHQRFSMAFPTRLVNSPSFGKLLGTAIEELFQNMTLSLFSDPAYLRRDDTPVNMTTFRSQNIYTYNATRLLLSYGIALALVLLASIFGLSMIFVNKASHSDKISTYLCSINQPDLQTLMPLKDNPGADPLPRCIADSKVKWRKASISLPEADPGNCKANKGPGTCHEHLILIAHVDRPEVESTSIDRSEYSR